MNEEEKQTIKVVEEVSPAVVSIVISKEMPKMKNYKLFPFPLPFGDQSLEGHTGEKEMVKVGGGSGVIVHPDGLVLTNKHVVFDPEAEYTVITPDGKEHDARVVSRDPINDIAVCKIEEKGLPTARLGNSDKVTPGQTVIAIGTPLGLFANTVSKGIVSGLARRIHASLGMGGRTEELRGVIQTDVAINQGNSGGPLLNLEGEVVGINTAVIYGAQNIGFCIPINWAKKDLEDIVKFGRIIKPFIGIMYVPINEKLQKTYNLNSDHGVLVLRGHVPGEAAIIKNSPADKAGIKENDIILEVDEVVLGPEKDLMDIVQNHKVGDKLKLKVLRDKEEIETELELAERK
jgi:S1-C subfamily serine protease